MQETYKEDSRKVLSADLERQIFEIFTLAPTMVASQGDIKVACVVDIKLFFYLFILL